MNRLRAFASRRPCSFATRERQLPLWLRQVLIALAVGLVLGWLGPFRTNPALPPVTRYGFWLGMAVTGLLFIRAVEPLVEHRLRGRVRLELLANGLASAVPMTFVVAWVLSMLQPDRPFPPSRMLVLYLCVTAVQLLIAFATARGRPGAAPALVANEGQTLLNRIPRELGTELIALEAEDHYLRVHTRVGSALILMRLSDAIAAAGPHGGVQVHRSWWVGRDAVEQYRRGDRNVLVLVNGLTVPVGRTFAAAARAAFG